MSLRKIVLMMRKIKIVLLPMRKVISYQLIGINIIKVWKGDLCRLRNKGNILIYLKDWLRNLGLSLFSCLIYILSLNWQIGRRSTLVDWKLCYFIKSRLLVHLVSYHYSIRCKESNYVIVS